MKNSNISKTVYLIAIIFALLLVEGCAFDNSEIVMPTNEAISIPTPYDDILAAVDSLNQTFDIEESRSAGSTVAVYLADTAGAQIGGRIGSWIGCAIGSLTGTPAGAVVGYFVGGAVGPYVCGALASGITDIICSSSGSLPNTKIYLKSDMSFSSLLPAGKDSIGYHHNVMMVKAHNRYSRYLLSNDSIDTELLYKDIVAYGKKVGLFEQILEDSVMMRALLNDIDPLCQASLQHMNGTITDANLLNTHFQLYTTNYGFTGAEAKSMIDFEEKVGFACSNLNETQLHSYAQSLCAIIQQSSLTSDEKEDLALTSSILINNCLCWNQ